MTDICPLNNWDNFSLDCQPSNGKCVVVALSGGIDSAVAACLLKQQGYRIIGVMLKFWAEADSSEPTGMDNRCCTASAVDDARALCNSLDSPFYLINCEEPFYDNVVKPFINDYLTCNTPSPCLRCNALVRFPKLLQVADALQADYLATGHYVQLDSQREKNTMKRAVDRLKDQSYMLYGLNQEQLPKLLFPLGTWHKTDVRVWAAEHGIPLSRKPDSQELCFINDGDYRAFLERQSTVSPQVGIIKHTDGRVLGEHRGLWNYTIGQRRGLGVAYGEPLFVVQKDAATNTLILGPEGPKPTVKCRIKQINWISGPPADDQTPLMACTRYHGRMYEVTLESDWVTFVEPAHLVVPGQGLVVYHDDVCMGGGVIAETVGIDG